MSLLERRPGTWFCVIASLLLVGCEPGTVSGGDPQADESRSAASLADMGGILARASRFGYCHSCSTAACMASVGCGDCWAMSEWICNEFAGAQIRSRVLQYGTKYSARHRSVQYWDGDWRDIDYSGISNMFRATSSKPGAFVQRTCYWSDPQSPLSAPFLFDAAFYLSLYPDLRAAYGSNHAAARQHWETWGIDEGRQASLGFNVRDYLAYHPDLRAAYGTNYRAAINHWLNWGIKEGRRTSRAFDVMTYLLRHTDLTRAFGACSYAEAVDHWLSWGINEGRQTAKDFDVQAYLARYPDLKAAFGTNYRAAFEHWFGWGAQEKRNPAPSDPQPALTPFVCDAGAPFMFDAAFYLYLYPDLRAAFGTDHAAARRHWETCGMNEGRQASIGFSVRDYLAYYSDLSAAFGTNYRAAINHYLDFGNMEGRRTSRAFDVRSYLQLHPDLSKALGSGNHAAAVNHWVNTGLQEGRQTADDFDVRAYLARYPDLKAAFGTNYRAAFEHWFGWGAQEKRNPAP